MSVGKERFQENCMLTIRMKCPIIQDRSNPRKEDPTVHIQATDLGRHAYGLSKMERAILNVSKDGCHMLELVDGVRQARATALPPKVIADRVARLETHGYVIVTK